MISRFRIQSVHCLHFIDKLRFFSFCDRFIFCHSLFNDKETVFLFFVFVNFKQLLEIMSEILATTGKLHF